MFIFEVMEDNSLKIYLNCTEEEKNDLLDIAEEMGAFQAFLDATESYWVNGWGVYTADALGQLSECEIIAEESAREDDYSITLTGKVWYHPNYTTESILYEVIKKGFYILPLWANFEDGENFIDPYNPPSMTEGENEEGFYDTFDGKYHK